MLSKLYVVLALVLSFNCRVHLQDASNIFAQTPTSVNIIVGDTAVLYCKLLPGVQALVQWNINGLAPNQSHGQTVRNKAALSILFVNNVTHNSTNVSCSAKQRMNDRLIFLGETDHVEILLQGALQSVTNISRNGSTIFWSPPFSLDLTNIEPDIVYCVEVYNITCGNRNLIISDCNVTEHSYTFYDLADGYIYEYIIIPRSNVEGASNGTPSQPFRDQFNTFSVTSSRVTAEDNSLMYMYEAELISNNAMTSNRQMPSTCTLLLESLDGLGDYEHTIACNRGTNPINLEVHPRRLWKCIVLAYGCRNDSVLVDDHELSTHDVQNISVSSPSVGSITVTGYFIQGSTAIGVLIITINSSNGTQYHLCRRNGNNAQVEDTISGLAGGHHRVSAFVLERSGHPFNRTATTPKSLFVINGSESAPSSPIMYALRSNSTHVCVTCMFKSSTPISCLAVIHQQISQLSSSGLMNIESSYKFNRSGDTAYGCIPTNLKEYQVGVVDGKFVVDLPQGGSSTVCGECIAAGSVLAVVVLIVAVVIIALKIRRKMLKDRRQDAIEASVYIMEEDTSSGNQYEHIRLSISTKVELSIGENMPLVSTHKVESGGDAEDNNEQSNFQTPPTLSPPMIPQAAAKLTDKAIEATKIIYSEPDCPNPGFSAPPLQGDEPQYSSVSNFKNSQGVVYAYHVVKPPTTTTQSLITDDSTKTTFEYSELIHPPDCQAKPATTYTLTATLSNNAENPTSPIVPSSPTPCTVGNLLPVLRPLASKWLSLGEALSIDEDDLDIINTNNETDEACLQDMLEFHEEKFDFQHTWEVMVTALKQINQEELSEKIQDLYIEPYTNPLPVDCTEGSPTSTPPPFKSVTVQQLYCHLLYLSSKWLSLGVALLIDEGQLDEISRNNETDKARLLKMLELYMMRSGHNWEEIEAAEKKVREEAVDLNQGGCAQKESGKEQVEMESHHNYISPDCHTPYAHGIGSGLQGCSSSVLDDNAMLTSGTQDTQLYKGDNTNNPLTSTPMNKTDARKASFSSSRIPPPKLDNSETDSGNVQPVGHDTGLEKIYVNGTTIDNCDTSLEPSSTSQGKTYNIIEDDGTCTTEASDDVAITDLSHGNTHESCAKKLSESGYVTLDADNSTTDVEEYSSINTDHPDDTGSELKEPIVSEPTSTLVNPSVKLQAMEEQSEGGSVSMYSNEAQTAEFIDKCVYEPFSGYIEKQPVHLENAGEHPGGDNKPGKDTKNDLHVPDTGD